MTYNFDPDKWYDNELFLIKSKFKNGEISQNEYDKAVEILDKKLEEMWKRLDGAYQINIDMAKVFLAVVSCRAQAGDVVKVFTG